MPPRKLACWIGSRTTRKTLVAVLAGGLATAGLAACSGSSAPSDPAAPQSYDPAGCNPVEHEPGKTTVVDIAFDGLDRSYRLFVPTSYDSTAPTPLTLN